MEKHNKNAMMGTDFYKTGHMFQYPDKTEIVYSTWIPRQSRLTFADKVVAFGFQSFIQSYLIDYFNDNFFNRPEEEVVAEYARVLKYCLGVTDPYTKHISELHILGYLPLRIKALPEGTLCPIRVPMLTIENTDPRFGWLTNYIETIASCSLWQSATSATIAMAYKKVLSQYAGLTSDIPDFVQFQGHDFSMRGMGSLESACTSGAGHLTSFVGTDTIPAIMYLENYYKANIENELVGCSVAATEHSVACAGGAGPGEEEATYKRLITKVYPRGIVSLVSDTWDLWNVLTNILPNLKSEIMNRDGKVVIRPDSGDPAQILCGAEIKTYPAEMELSKILREIKGDALDELERETPHGEYGGDAPDVLFKHGDVECIAKISVDWNRYDKQYYYIDGASISYEPTTFTPEQKGVIQLLYETFGGTKNSKGYIQLDPHVGAIYGDAITVARADDICRRLKDKGFASTNVVLGIGSYTYQYNTRDTFGFAMKATHCVIDGKEVNIFKDPVTDADKVKKSLTGRCVVIPCENGELKAVDGLNISQEAEWSASNQLQTVFEDGKLLIEVSLAEVRARITAQM